MQEKCVYIECINHQGCEGVEPLDEKVEKTVADRGYKAMTRSVILYIIQRVGMRPAMKWERRCD